MYDNTLRIIDVNIDEILPNRFQPRIQFDEEEILELSDSIKEHGVIQPIVVRTIGDKYEIISGERRYKASVLAGKETVPVIVKNLNDKDSVEIALIENIQRKNLTPIEEALSYKKILDMGYITQEKLAEKIGKSQSAVANKIRLLNLSDEVQEALLENKISERHARSLLKLKDLKKQNELLERIINERLTVRRTDEEINIILEEKTVNKIEEIEKGKEKEELKEERGEKEMNNEFFNTQQTQPPVFDIFGQNQTNVPSQPQSSETPEQPTSFNMFGSFGQFNVPKEDVAAAPEPPVNPATVEFKIPEVPAAPTVEAPVTPVVDTPTISTPEFKIPEVPVAPAVETPVAPVVETPINSTPEFKIPEVPAAPTVEAPVTPVVDTPTISTPEFKIPEVSVAPAAEVPVTSPIIESPIVTPVDTPSQPVETIQTIEEAVPVEPSMPAAPEPIIITDYSKQYDPVMPNTQPQISKAEFKEVIAAIRECSSKIEQYGYKIDVEEYDLAALYQVVMKIEK